MHMRVNRNNNSNKKTVIKNLLVLRKMIIIMIIIKVYSFIHSNFNGYSTEQLSIKFQKALFEKNLQVSTIFSKVLGLIFVLHSHKCVQTKPNTFLLLFLAFNSSTNETYQSQMNWRRKSLQGYWPAHIITYARSFRKHPL